MPATSSQAAEEHAWKDDTPSSFLKLSAEIRNKIYHLTLVEEPASSVGVEDMHPEQWHEAKKAGRGTRTSYKTKDHNAYVCPYEEGYMVPKRCTFKNKRWKRSRVSYTMWRFLRTATPPRTIGMLALNRQTRAEAIPIFYGGNKFDFQSMSALLPFLRDRCELSLQSMRFFHLELRVDEGRSQTSRQDGWAQIFADLPKFGRLSLQKLTIHIYDPYCCYAWQQKLETMTQCWVREMARNITNLDMLGGSFNFSELKQNGVIREDIPTVRLLWEFLAPKMLKRIGEEPHDARSLCCVLPIGPASPWMKRLSMGDLLPHGTVTAISWAFAHK